MFDSRDTLNSIASCAVRPRFSLLLTVRFAAAPITEDGASWSYGCLVRRKKSLV